MNEDPRSHMDRPLVGPQAGRRGSVSAALRDALGLGVGVALLGLIALTYGGGDNFQESPYVYLSGAAILAAVTGALAEPEARERGRAAVFAGVVVFVAGAVLLTFLFWADSSTGA